MRVVIVGAGGHAHVVSDALTSAMRDLEIVGHVDDDSRKMGERVLDRPVLGPIEALGRFAHDAVALGIGDNAIRAMLWEQLKAKERLIGVVHPRAVIAQSAIVAPSAVVFAGAVVNAATSVRDDAIINTGATIDHQCVIGEHSHVAPGAHIAGGCTLGRGVFVAMGVVVAPGRKIGDRAIVGAGSTVLQDIPDGVLAYGTPARVVRSI